MKATSVPTSTWPAPTWWPPNQTTPVMVTSSTRMVAGNRKTNSWPTLSPTREMSRLASSKRSVSACSRTKARTTRIPVSCSRSTRLMVSRRSWKERNSGTMRRTVEPTTRRITGAATAMSQDREGA